MVMSPVLAFCAFGVSFDASVDFVEAVSSMIVISVSGLWFSGLTVSHWPVPLELMRDAKSATLSFVPFAQSRVSVVPFAQSGQVVPILFVIP